ARVETNGDVGYLDRLASHGKLAKNALIALAQRNPACQLYQSRLEVARGPQVKLLGGLVVLKDRAAVGPDEVVGARDDRGEDDIDVERRAAGLADLAEPAQLADRARELGRAFLQLCEEPHILDGDDGLVGKGSHECDLAVGERPWLTAP